MFNLFFTIGAALVLIPVAIGLIAMGVNLGSLRKKFTQLGTLKGLNYKQIVAAVGKGANSIQHVSDGSVRVWVSMDYRITLLFDTDDVCLGVSNETSTF